MRALILGSIVFLAACGGGPSTVPFSAAEHAREIDEWRADREQRLRAEDGWLTLVGLHWLAEGENRFGTDPAGEIVLPEGTAPAYAGSLFLEDEQVRVLAADGAGLMLGDLAVTERILADDNSDEPDVLGLGDLLFHVIRREDRIGVRVKNPNAPLRSEFRGMEHFPIEPRFRFEGRLVPYEEPRQITISTVIGSEIAMTVPGRVSFEIDGEMHSLDPIESGDRYWFLFRDATSGTETYGAGRYLYADAAEDGRVVVDFNKAYNPPCVFTPYATCPLPPPQNRLSVRIEAGEKMYAQ